MYWKQFHELFWRCFIPAHATDIAVQLCAGRHDMPAEVKDCVFSNVENPMDFSELDHIAEEFVKNLPRRITTLHLFVTGFTPCLISVVKACAFQENIRLICWHYDRDKEDYKDQECLSLY